MHYQINEFIVKSELAAKPITQTNKNVLDYIYQLPHGLDVLDYGCGKLRYSLHLAKQVHQIVAIDSREQIKTLDKSTYTHLHNMEVMSIECPDWYTRKYDVVFCTNVLSAIPYEEKRFDVLKNAKDVLKKNGYAFISVQYRNSYFSQYKNRDDAVAFHDGWLIHNKSTNRCSFYGLLSADYISEMCYKTGFKEVSVTKIDGSCFIEARK